MSILEKLYNGKLMPVEQVIPRNADYRPLADKIGNERGYFAEALSAEDRERFDSWNKLIFEYEEMIEFANFEHGFKLGSQLTFEIFMARKEE